jgi:hypothetical protein
MSDGLVKKGRGIARFDSSVAAQPASSAPGVQRWSPPEARAGGGARRSRSRSPGRRGGERDGGQAWRGGGRSRSRSPEGGARHGREQGRDSSSSTGLGSSIVTQDALAALRARMLGLAGGGAAPQPGPGDATAGMSTQLVQQLSSAAALASRPAASAPAQSCPSLGAGGIAMGMPSGTSIIPAPAGVMVNAGASPAQAAGMLGPGGLISLLAAVHPSRVLVLANAMTDALLESGRADPPSLRSQLAEVAADIAAEAQVASPGALLRLIIPLPREAGELIDPPVGVRLGGAIKVVGAAGLLEDTKDGIVTTAGTARGGGGRDGQVVGANMEGATVIPLTAEAFYRKVVAAGGGAGTGGAGGWSNLDGLGSGVGGAMSALNAAGVGEEQAEEEEEGEGGVATGAFDADGRTRNLGKVFLEFASVGAALGAQRELSGRFFEGRITVGTFAHPAKFVAGDLCGMGPPFAFAMTASNAPTEAVPAGAPPAGAAPGA